MNRKDLTEIMTISCSHESILLYGRYNKMHRKVSQTPWLIDGATIDTAVSSVQDEIAKNVNHIFDPQGGECYLHAAGREDIDVRMLGTGRPFIFEFINPRKAQSCVQ